MKKKIRTKLFGLTLTAALALAALTACGNPPSTAPLPETPSTAASLSEEASSNSDNSSIGTVLLSVNPEIEMDDNGLGNVVALTGRNQDARTLLASYTGYEGRPCTEVVGELVDEIHARGYFDTTVGGHEKNIILKLERGSAYPNDQFLNELADAVRVVVAADQIGSQPVTLDQDDYDDAYGDKGYINASAAQNILSTQLGRDDIQFLEKEYDLEDGEYEVEFLLDGVKYEYEVDAYTGKVIEMDAGFQDYDDTDYGPYGDGVTDYGVTDYDNTDYGPNADGITDYGDTDYGPYGDGVTDYSYTDYGDSRSGSSNYGNSNYSSSNYGDTNSDDGGSDYDREADHGDSDYDD